MGSVGNFWKNLNNGSNEKEDEILPDNSNNGNKKPLTTTTDEEIDALIDSLEKVRQQSDKQEKGSEEIENPVTFNTDLFKQIASEKDSSMKNTNTGVTGKGKKKEQTVQKTKKESQVDKGMGIGKKATIITKSTIIAGNISTEDDLIIDGSVCGDVDCKGELTISGEVAGNAIAASINIKTSKFDGDVRSEGKIDINEGTVVLGNIYGESANIAGAVKGEIIVTNEARLEPTAIVKGNIRAKSVQIEHGAVLQGFCELAYESMDLDDFFGESATDDTEEVETVAEDTNTDVELLNQITSQVEEKEDELDKAPVEEEVQENEPEEIVEEKNEVGELELEEDDDKKEFMQEMENNYSNFMDQLKIDGEN